MRHDILLILKNQKFPLVFNLFIENKLFAN